MTNNRGESDSNSILPPRVKSALTSFKRWSLRIIVVTGTLFTTWVIVGSIWFPGWWFAAIVGGGLLRRSFVIGNNFLFTGGFTYLVEYQIWLLFCLAGFCLATVLVAVFLPERRDKFVKAVDRWAIPIIAVCIFLFFVDALILFKTGGGPSAELWLNMLNDGDQPQLSPPPDAIHAPIDFLYLDSARVTHIYSEIEPDLVEQRRTLSSEKKSRESLALGAGSTTLEAESSNNGKATSEYQRAESTASRQCINLINYTLKGGYAHSFTTMDPFYKQPMMSPYRNLLESGHAIPEMKALIVKEDLIAKEKKEAYEIFKREATGFVLVEGIFHISRSNGMVEFEEEFSPRPHRILFRFTLPAKADSDFLRDGRSMHAFGEVTHQLDEKGVILIHPLAVF